MLLVSLLTAAMSATGVVPHLSMADTRASLHSAVVEADSTIPAKSSRRHWWSVPTPDLHMPKVKLPKYRNASAESLRDASDRLRELVGQEEMAYAQSGRYTKKIDGLARPRAKSDTALDAVHVDVIYATKTSWVAVASHPSAPLKSCVVFVGNRDSFPVMPRTREKAFEAVDEGRPVCDK